MPPVTSPAASFCRPLPVRRLSGQHAAGTACISLPKRRSSQRRWPVCRDVRRAGSGTFTDPAGSRSIPATGRSRTARAPAAAEERRRPGAADRVSLPCRDSRQGHGDRVRSLAARWCSLSERLEALRWLHHLRSGSPIAPTDRCLAKETMRAGTCPRKVTGEWASRWVENALFESYSKVRHAAPGRVDR